jgi:hypothetical protein
MVEVDFEQASARKSRTTREQDPLRLQVPGDPTLDDHFFIGSFPLTRVFLGLLIVLMDAATKAKFKELEDNGYLPQLRAFAMSKCAPIFWATQDSLDEAPKVLHNATGVCVKTGQRDLLITAAHVLAGFRADVSNYPNLRAYCGTTQIDLEAALIAVDNQLDLATFLLTSPSTGQQFHTPAQWPPEPLQKNGLVLYGGFPGTLRTQDGGNLDAPFQSFCWKVTDVTPANLVMQIDFANLYWPGHEGERINERPGGISGGPVFRVIEKLNESPRKVYLELVGIVYEYLEPFETMRARPIGHVQADGSLVPL